MPIFLIPDERLVLFRQSAAIYAIYSPWGRYGGIGILPKENIQKSRFVVRVQYAALPYRFNEVDGLEILLVTTPALFNALY
jgi:hypothetical protein